MSIANCCMAVKAVMLLSTDRKSSTGHYTKAYNYHMEQRKRRNDATNEGLFNVYHNNDYCYY